MAIIDHLPGLILTVQWCCMPSRGVARSLIISKWWSQSVHCRAVRPRPNGRRQRQLNTQLSATAVGRNSVQARDTLHLSSTRFGKARFSFMDERALCRIEATCQGLKICIGLSLSSWRSNGFEGISSAVNATGRSQHGCVACVCRHWITGGWSEGAWASRLFVGERR